MAVAFLVGYVKFQRMTNQDSDSLSLTLWRELAKKWWIILIFVFVGAVLSLKWRKQLPNRQSIEVSVYSRMPSEFFRYFCESAENIQITITKSEELIYRLNVQSDTDVENRTRIWAEQANRKITELLGDISSTLNGYLEDNAARAEKLCQLSQFQTRDGLLKCQILENEIVSIKQRRLREDTRINIFSVRPFIIQPTSVPIRDILFGAFIGFISGLMLLGTYIQIKLVKNK